MPKWDDDWPKKSASVVRLTAVTCGLGKTLVASAAVTFMAGLLAGDDSNHSVPPQPEGGLC
jgi:hypothetical protein